jgi:hypothetical protein
MPTKTSAFALAISILGLMAPAASATVHSGHFVYREPLNEPTLLPQAPTVELEGVEHEFSISYDDQAGSIVVTIENYAPALWPHVLYQTGFQLGPKCEEERGLVQGLVKPSDKASLSEAILGTLSVEGLGGQLEVLGPFNGQFFSLTFSNPHLVGLDLRCVTLGQEETFPLSGYPPLNVPLRTYRATRTQVQRMEDAANEHHSDSFNVRSQYLTRAKTTSNGWGDAEQRYRHPTASWQAQRGIYIVFRLTTARWHTYAYGSPASSGLCRPGKEPPIPSTVCRALGL